MPFATLMEVGALMDLVGGLPRRCPQGNGHRSSLIELSKHGGEFWG
jgi:hypothetical protein